MRNVISKENQMKKFKGLRHGEVALIPTKEILSGKTIPKGEHILAHSETGHHHVLEGKGFTVTETDWGQIFVDVERDTALVHRKQFDQHNTIVIPPSKLKRYEMVEYNPAEKAIQVVKD